MKLDIYVCAYDAGIFAKSICIGYQFTTSNKYINLTERCIPRRQGNIIET